MDFKKYNTLIFDLDDTLIDFEYSEAQSLKKVHEEYFEAEVHINHFVKTFHEINSNLWSKVNLGKLKPSEVKNLRFQQLIELHDTNHDIDVVARRYEHHLGFSGRWFPSAEQTLKKLSGHFKCGIITNGLSNVQKNKIAELKLFDYCQSIIVSECVNISKPSKEIFELALTELKSKPEETLMIGDSLLSDYQGAINAGIDFCWVNVRNRLLGDFPKPALTVHQISELNELVDFEALEPLTA